MEADPQSILRQLGLPIAGSCQCWRCCLKWRVQGPERHLQTDGCTLGMGLTSDRVASAVHVVVLMVVQVAVAAAEMLPVLAVVQVTVAVDGDTIPSPAASDG
ncbi:hypothetical protein NDU88_007299 [Pleurodeles waltl]|uniref:Uncharacterized protein n=1 Tax=Pleurodeles waltl TaxID=8319 RepID=A0AAV7SS00_PLEWA|nr:hypothetical protein NDU88_007299 [Pleurodeles waltl]